MWAERARRAGRAPRPRSRPGRRRLRHRRARPRRPAPTSRSSTRPAGCTPRPTSCASSQKVKRVTENRSKPPVKTLLVHGRDDRPERAACRRASSTRRSTSTASSSPSSTARPRAASPSRSRASSAFPILRIGVGEGIDDLQPFVARGLRPRSGLAVSDDLYIGPTALAPGPREPRVSGDRIARARSSSRCVVLFAAIVLVFFVFFQPVRVDGPSMLPTLADRRSWCSSRSGCEGPRPRRHRRHS